MVPGGERLLSKLLPLPEPKSSFLLDTSYIDPAEVEQKYRELVISEAMSWVGTKFHHGQRTKGAGVDCGQFLLGVYHNAGCIPYVKTDYYPKDFHLHSNYEWYKELVEQFAQPILYPKMADVALFKLDGGLIFSHGVIVIDWPTKVIHSHLRHGVAIADATQGFLKNQPVKFYQPKCFK
jgi:hypothetical protein